MFFLLFMQIFSKFVTVWNKNEKKKTIVLYSYWNKEKFKGYLYSFYDIKWSLFIWDMCYRIWWSHSWNRYRLDVNFRQMITVSYSPRLTGCENTFSTVRGSVKSIIQAINLKLLVYRIHFGENLSRKDIWLIISISVGYDKLKKYSYVSTLAHSWPIDFNARVLD